MISLLWLFLIFTFQSSFFLKSLLPNSIGTCVRGGALPLADVDFPARMKPTIFYCFFYFPGLY